MKLTEAETSVAERLRRMERTWRWLRWPCLIFSLICALLFGWTCWVFLRTPGHGADDGLIMGGLFFMSLVVVGSTLGRWRGDLATRLLLLRLEERKRHDV